MNNIELLNTMIEVSGLPVTAKHSDNGEYTLYSEYNIPLIKISDIGQLSYSAVGLSYNHHFDTFESCGTIGVGCFDDVCKEALKKIVSDRVAYWLEWQEASNTIHEIDEYSYEQ